MRAVQVEDNVNVHRSAIAHLTLCLPTRVATVARMANTHTCGDDGTGNGVKQVPTQLQNKLHAQALAIADSSAQQAAQLELSDTVAHAIADLAWQYAEQLAFDTALYARHRGDTRVTVADAWLVAKRCTGVYKRLLERINALGLDTSS